MNYTVKTIQFYHAITSENPTFGEVVIKYVSTQFSKNANAESDAALKQGHKTGTFQVKKINHFQRDREEKCIELNSSLVQEDPRTTKQEKR